METEETNKKKNGKEKSQYSCLFFKSNLLLIDTMRINTHNKHNES